MATVPHDFEGAQLGAYRVLRRIGDGGMGAVWLAEHVTIGRHAALKVLHPEYSARPDIVARFFNEARAATAIKDPGIVQIFDFGEHDGCAYLVMELLEGEPLDRRLARAGVLAVRDALRIIRQVATTLAAAHARGIVHRDLKPENVFLVPDPEVAGGERAKILDFGIAKLSGDPNGFKTQTSAVMGTPMYMSPEQCRGAGLVDQRSDVYALGCVLFALVVGHPPFTADGIGDIIAMHLREPAPAPSSYRSGIPPEVDQLVLRCLAKDPALRFASASELAVALGALLGSSPQIPVSVASAASGALAVAGGDVHGRAVAPTTLSSAAGTSAGAPARHSRAGLAIALASTGAIAAITAVVLARPDGHDAAPAAPPPTDAVALDPAPIDAPRSSAPIPDPVAERLVRASERLRTALRAFARWAPDHGGAPCPTTGDLATVVGEPRGLDDPWGHPLAVTCTEQPANQIVGVVSAGPDGAFDTDDDLASWRQGPDTTTLVEGPRWSAVAPPAAPARRPARPPQRRDRRSVPSHPAAVHEPAPSRPPLPSPAPPPPAPPHAGSATPTPSPPAPTTHGGIPRTR